MVTPTTSSSTVTQSLSSQSPVQVGAGVARSVSLAEGVGTWVVAGVAVAVGDFRREGRTAWRCLVDHFRRPGLRLRDGEAPILAEVPIEGDRLFDTEALHNNEAQRIAEGVALVFVGTHECDRTLLVSGTNPFDPATGIAQGVEKLDGITRTTAGAREKQRIRFDDHDVGCHQGPPFVVRKLKQRCRLCVVAIVAHPQREESAAIDNGTLHRLS